MKTIKMNTIKTMVGIMVAVIVFACSQSGTETSKSSNACTPKIDIHTAVLYNNLEAVQQHIEAGTDLNVIEPMGGSTPLISAATFDKREIVKVLIDAGADLTIKNNDGSTALHTAAFFCRVEIVQLLLDAGANKDIKNNYDATPAETISGSFEDIKPVYEMLQQQLSPLGLQLDMKEIEETRPVIAIMLQ